MQAFCCACMTTVFWTALPVSMLHHSERGGLPRGLVRTWLCGVAWVSSIPHGALLQLPFSQAASIKHQKPVPACLLCLHSAYATTTPASCTFPVHTRHALPILCSLLPFEADNACRRTGQTFTCAASRCHLSRVASVSQEDGNCSMPLHAIYCSTLCTTGGQRYYFTSAGPSLLPSSPHSILATWASSLLHSLLPAACLYWTFCCTLPSVLRYGALRSPAGRPPAFSHESRLAAAGCLPATSFLGCHAVRLYGTSARGRTVSSCMRRAFLYATKRAQTFLVRAGGVFYSFCHLLPSALPTFSACLYLFCTRRTPTWLATARQYYSALLLPVPGVAVRLDCRSPRGTGSQATTRGLLPVNYFCYHYRRPGCIPAAVRYGELMRGLPRTRTCGLRHCVLATWRLLARALLPPYTMA